MAIRPNHVKVGERAASEIKHIFLDDVRQDGVVEFDQSEGWLRRYVKQNGSYRVVRGELITERVEGNITIEWID